MKKSLLLSLMATAGMTAFAAQPVASTTEAEAVGVASKVVEMGMSNLEAVEAPESSFNSKIQLKDDAQAFPSIALPAGVFIRGYEEALTRYYVTLNGGAKFLSPLSIPPYSNVTFTSSDLLGTPNTANLKWTYNYFAMENGQLGVRTNTVAATTDVTLPAMPYLEGYYTEAPKLSDGTNECMISSHMTPYAMYKHVFSDTTLTVSSVRWNPSNLKDLKMDAFTNADADTDSLAFFGYANFYTKYPGYGFRLPKPATTYGMFGVMFTGYVDGFKGEKLSFSVYKVAKDETSRWAAWGNAITHTYELGERIGGGYLTPDQIPAFEGKYQTFLIPVIEQIGLFEGESYLNIDDEVIVMFDDLPFSTAANASGVFPSIVMSCNPRYNCEGVWHLADGEYRSMNITGFYLDESKVALAVPMTMASGINLVYGNLAAYDEEDYYTFKANVAGEEKTFEFEPTMDLNDESGFAIIEGEGALDWYEYTVGDYNKETGLQTVTVKVNALPAGVTGRASDLLVKIPGAEQVIKITQGEVSGIDSVVSDAAVVSSTYFDLMGRELNAEPETGMFIRQDVKADGTKVATKVVK